MASASPSAQRQTTRLKAARWSAPPSAAHSSAAAASWAPRPAFGGADARWCGRSRRGPRAGARRELAHAQQGGADVARDAQPRAALAGRQRVGGHAGEAHGRRVVAAREVDVADVDPEPLGLRAPRA